MGWIWGVAGGVMKHWLELWSRWWNYEMWDGVVGDELQL